MSGPGRWRGAFVAAALLASSGTASATDAFEPDAALVRPTERWARLERLVDADPHMVQEPFLPLLEHRDPEIRTGFDAGAPPSSHLLLHYAKGWDAADPGKPPVLLVHGAGLTANHCFADRPIEQPYPGLAAALTKAGRAVFAITFAHPHGDNVLQAEALADAIARVRRVTGAKKVDLVAHSKGGMPCRIYLSSAGPRWTTRYRKDVRRYVMLGTPNGGTDVGFAYPNLNYWILQNKSPAPLSWTQCLYYGVWMDYTKQSIYAEGCFPGQAQMVARWDDRYGKTRAQGQLDIETTYEGGRGNVSLGHGIDRAIRDGGDMIAALGEKAIHPDVELALLAGTNPWIMSLVGERRGPSDGLLLVASVFETGPLTRRGARVLRKDLRDLNHLQLVYSPRANDWVREALDE